MKDPTRPWQSVLQAPFVVFGYGTLLVGLAFVLGLANQLLFVLGVIVLGIVLGLIVAAFVVFGRAAVWAWLVRIAPPATDVLVLGALVPWGLAWNTSLRDCSPHGCRDGLPFRPFAEPEIFGFVALHAITVLAYTVSRRRSAPLHGPAELLVHSFLMVGIVVQTLVAVHLGPFLLLGFLPPTLPALAPVLTVILYTSELCARLRRRGLESALPRPIHVRTLLGSLALTPILLGLYAVVQRAWLGWGPLQGLTRSCGGLLSTLPAPVLEDCYHYLCTVAARGHPWLVGPERLGRRAGVTIVVNRQLAVANAFEDLLHERWPRFGELARRIYDRLGLPVSRVIRGRWMADLVYLAMKPAEWGFYLVLVLLDPGAPEARIGRMYR